MGEGSVAVPVIAGIAVGITLILLVAAFPVQDNSPQSVYERNFARITADADCIEDQCAYDNIAYCEVGTTSFIPSSDNYVWRIDVTDYDGESCKYSFMERDVRSNDFPFSSSITYHCRVFAEDLRKINANTTDAYVQNIISRDGVYCGISMP